MNEMANSGGRPPFLALLAYPMPLPAMPRGLRPSAETGMLHAEGSGMPFIEGMLERAAASRSGDARREETDTAAVDSLITKSVEPTDPDIVRAAGAARIPDPDSGAVERDGATPGEGAAALESLLTRSFDPADPDVIRAGSGRLASTDR